MIVVLIAGIMIWVAYAHAEADASAVLPLIGTLLLAGIIAVDIRLSIKRWNLK